MRLITVILLLAVVAISTAQRGGFFETLANILSGGGSGGRGNRNNNNNNRQNSGSRYPLWLDTSDGRFAKFNGPVQGIPRDHGGGRFALRFSTIPFVLRSSGGVYPRQLPRSVTNQAQLFSSVVNPSPLSASTMNSPLTVEGLAQLRKEFFADEKNRVAQNACTRTDPLEICTIRGTVEDISHVFNKRIEHEGKPMTNQKTSGRCWIFAMLNTARIPFMKKYNLDEFEFSQSFLFYYDKIERCNYFLHSMVDLYTRGEKVDGRLYQFILSDPISDGGQWDMLINLVTKYGMMPKKVFPESYSSENSMRMNRILTSKLREYSKEIRDFMSRNPDGEQIKSLLNKQLTQLHKIIGICLGIPKDEFTWEYYDKNKAYNKVGPISPQKFYEEYVKPVFNIEDKICLVNDPRETNVYGKAYTVDLLGNTIGGRMTIYNNQPVELLMRAAIDSISSGEPVWFGCEVAKRFAGKLGIEDMAIHDYKSIFGTEVSTVLNKAERMLYGDSKMTHAMVLTAVSLDDNEAPTKWRVENSWGDDRGEKGYLLMTNDWFKEFVFEVVVDKKFVSTEVLQVFEQTPIVLPAWDPMGSLA